MKKIIWLLLCLPILTVKASTYYTDYDIWEYGSSVSIEENEALKKEEVKYYNTYEYISKYVGDYNDSSCDGLEICTNVRKTKYNYDDNSSSTNAIKGKDGKIKSFKITNNYDYQTLNFLQIRSGFNLIDYSIVDGTNGIEYYEKLKDTSWNFAFNHNDYFVIELSEAISIGDLKIYITQNSSVYPLFLDIELFYDDGSSIEGSIIRKNLKIVNEETFNKISSSVGKYNDTTTNGYSTEKITVYEGYQNEKVILNEYKREGDNLILDDYIIKYDYFKRDYLKVLDEIDESLNIRDSIIDTSFDKSKININFNKDDESNMYYIQYEINNNVFNHNLKIIKNEISNNIPTIDNDNLSNKKPIIDNNEILNKYPEDNPINSNPTIEPIFPINDTDKNISTINSNDNASSISSISNIEDTQIKPITSSNNKNNNEISNNYIPEILDVTYEENTNPTTTKVIKPIENILEVEPVNNSFTSNNKFIFFILILIIICLILLVKKLEK